MNYNALFDMPKVDNTKKKPKKSSVNIKKRIDEIVATANRLLAHHKDEYIIIYDEKELEDYIDTANKNGIMALDTETTGLDPMRCKIVGVCIYTPNKKAAYIPINHISYITKKRYDKQLTNEQVANILAKFNGKYIMHNATFDIRILRKNLNLYVKCYWDTQLGANCINEIGSHKLKDLHMRCCEHTDDEAYTFDKLFKGVTFDLVPISTAYLYAAGDPIKTYDLYLYQDKELTRLGSPRDVLLNIEMPIVDVVCNMEDRGIALDYDVVNYLQNKYHKLHEEAVAKSNKVLAKYDNVVDTYKMQHSNHKLSKPINIGSPKQLETLLYDILKLVPLKKKGRSTDEEVLEHFAKGKHKELCESILEVRKLDKLIGTYIDKMPEVAIDKRVYARYNQYGAATGRFSSQDPRRIISNWGLKIQLIQGRAVA